MKQLIIFILAAVMFACSSKTGEVFQPVPEDDLSSLNLPEGFGIHTFANVENARSMAVSPNGTVFVGNRRKDKVYALQDTDGDWKADKTYILDSGLMSPNGVAYYDGDLYVAEISRILRYPDIENNLDNTPEPEVVYDAYPTEAHHGWKYIAFGPDGKLYVPVGAPCNICKSDDPVFASITRMNPDGSDMEIVAHGVRNSVGFDWHPDSDELWFTDNGRDNLGDEIPPCELNRVSSAGEHFGYPYCHGGTIQDPEFGDQGDCADYVAPRHNFQAHTAPLGFSFYSGNMFPSDYQGDIIVAQHGSWNRSAKIGYRLMRVKLDGDEAVEESVFIDGWLDDESQEAWGRPVDVVQLTDGSILVSDDEAGKVYRVYYQG